MKLHVVVRGDPEVNCFRKESKNNFVFVSQKGFRKKFKVPFIKRPALATSLLDPVVRRDKIALLEHLQAETGVIDQFLRDDKAPIRQYFHSRTNMPMLEGDWDHDSDDDSIERWIIREKEAVSWGVSMFVTLHNFVVVPSDVIIYDFQIPRGHR